MWTTHLPEWVTPGPTTEGSNGDVRLGKDGIIGESETDDTFRTGTSTRWVACNLRQCLYHVRTRPKSYMELILASLPTNRPRPSDSIR